MSKSLCIGPNSKWEFPKHTQTDTIVNEFEFVYRVPVSADLGPCDFY